MSDGRFQIASEGKLVTARVFALKAKGDADDYGDALRIHVAKMNGPVLLADHRPIVIYPQLVADRLVELFTQMNTRLERVAIVAAKTNATLLLQLERLVREAAYERRRVFLAPADAIEHLAPSLTPNEIAAARAFLSGFTPSS